MRQGPNQGFSELSLQLEFSRNHGKGLYCPPALAFSSHFPFGHMKILLIQSLAIPAIQIAFDLFARMAFASRGGSKWDASIYFTALFACWAFSFAFLALVRLAFRCGKWPGRLVAGSFALIHTFLLVTNYFLFQFFGEYLFPGAIAFLTDPLYMMDYLHTFSGFLPVAGVVATWLIFYGCMRWRAEKGVSLLAMTAMFVIAVPSGGYALHKLEKLSEYRMPPDMVAVESLSKHFLRVRDRVWPLRPSRRLPVEYRAKGAVAKPRTVLVILNESMGTRGIPFAYPVNDSAPNGMPRLTARVEADSTGFVVFKRAFTNSTATQVSMASLFSGVSPEESHWKLHCMPMMWDLAKAAGYRTAYFSSQRLRWASLSDFLLGQPIDSLVAREQTDHPPVNDMGIDDFHLVETLEAWVNSHPHEPLFVVWNTNALHAPFQAESRFVDLSGVAGSRFDKALHFLDTATARVFALLERSGRMDDALIINTADHGEDPEPKHPMARIFSYYDEFIRIPLWMHLPQSLRGSEAEKALRHWSQYPVANIDIVPTLAHLWGIKPGSTAEKFPESCALQGGKLPWSGISLLTPKPSDDRVLVVLSTNDTRRWDCEGFGLVRGPWRLVLHPRMGRHLFDAESDPSQVHDLMATASDSVMAPLRTRITENEWLRRIYDHHLAAENREP